MAQEVLAGSVLFGVVLVAIVVVLSGRGWRQYAPVGDVVGSRAEPSALSRASRSPTVWTIAFVLAVVAAGLATVAFIDGALPEAVQQNAGLFLAGAGAGVLTAYLFYGTFVSARNRGMKNAQAAAFGSWAVAMLALVAIVFKLVGFI